MNLPLKVLKRFFNGPSAVLVGFTVAVVAFGVAVGGLRSQLADGELTSVWNAAGQSPGRVVFGLAGFALAFLLRSVIWSIVLPGLGLGQAWAGIHFALGANHVLPFRLGEPLRVLSAVRRAGTPLADSVASSIALRTSDIATLVLIGLVLAPMAVIDTLGLWGLGLFGLAVTSLACLAFVANRRGFDVSSHIPRIPVLAATGSAWLLEAILIYQVAPLAGVALSYKEAVLVTSVAVSAQLVAVAPGGLGTYEAAATAALVLSGVEIKSALALAVTAHLLKTIYSLTTGVIAMIIPRPSMIGRLRVPRPITPVEREAVGDGPIVLFMPAYQEGPRIAEVLSRTPETVLGRPIVRLVIDDGSTDDTVAQAESAGAQVVSLDQNQGLGAAVAEGFRHAVTELGASVVVFCDADGEYDPADIADLVGPILDGNSDYVVGSRFAGDIEHMRPNRRFGNLTLTRWVRWMTRASVTDGQSGYRALSAQAAGAVHMAHDYNYAQVLTIDLIQKGFHYSEVPITYHFRESGDSFVKLGTYLRTVVPTVWRLLNAPPSEPTVASVINLVDEIPSVRILSPS